MKKVKISPSILSADFSKLGEEIQALDKAGADSIHIDIMDGSFVPNLTFGVPVIKHIRPLTKKIFDVHLMVKNPENYIDTLVETGADIITFHVEACNHIDRLLSYIKSKGKKAGIALNPSTHEGILEYIINKVDLILVMTVNPGFSGQSFLESQIKKIQNIKNNYVKNKNIIIEVDGGVDETNAHLLTQAGADMLVVGTAIFKNSNYKDNINKLKSRGVNYGN